MISPCDFHIHVSAYRVASPVPDHTVAPILRDLCEKGYRTVGVVEHLNESPIHPIDYIRQLVADFRQCDLPIDAFVGTEADITDCDGTVSCDAALKGELGLDYVIGSVHLDPSHFERVEDYIEEEFLRILGCLRHSDSVDIIGHPWGQGQRWQKSGAIPAWSFSLIPQEMRQEIIRLSATTNKALEINIGHNDVDNDPAYVEFLHDLSRGGGRVSMGSDAHRISQIPPASRSQELLARLDSSIRLWSPQHA